MAFWIGIPIMPVREQVPARRLLQFCARYRCLRAPSNILIIRLDGGSDDAGARM